MLNKKERKSIRVWKRRDRKRARKARNRQRRVASIERIKTRIRVDII